MPTFVQTGSISLNDAALSLVKKRRSVTAFFKFEVFPFVEETSLDILVNEGSQSPVVEDAAFGNGCRFRPQSRFSFPMELRSNNRLSVGFWLKPVNVRPTINPASGETVYYRSALFDKAEFSYSASSSIVTVEGGSFVFFEECRDSNKNVLKILLVSDNDEQCVVSSIEYTCDVLHYFWIVYDGLTQSVSIYIDGIQREVTIEDGNIPQQLNFARGTAFNLNKSAIGFNSLLRTNTGLLDELSFFSEAMTDLSVIGRIINYGTEFAIDETLFNREEVHQGFAFDDPTSLQINTVYSNGTNIYAGRSDGRVFKGDRLLWEVRRDFANAEEERFIKKNLLSTDSVITFEDGALKIEKAAVQIR